MKPMPARPSYRIVDGFRMPQGFPASGFGAAREFQARPGDVIVATYPKCGTTWMQYIVRLLHSGGEPLPAGATIGERVPHIEEVGTSTIEGLAAPRLLKTHLPATLFPLHAEARHVLVVRNPFDCAVSFYHHTRGFPQHYDFADGRFDDFFECFVRGEVDFGDYFDHLLSWHAWADAPNVLLVSYEALKADPAKTIRSVGRFIGGVAAESAAAPAVIDAIVAESAFSRMRRNQTRWASRRPDGMPAFVRRGEVGDWRKHFTAAQARRLLERFDAKLAGSSAARLWPDEIEAVRAFARA